MKNNRDNDCVMVCDKCNAEFPIASVNINECSVEVDGKSLLLTYFVCPECEAIYKVLFVDENTYRKLLYDFLGVKKRIHKLQGKGNPQLIERLQEVAQVKMNRTKEYVIKMNKQYSGTFTFEASVNNPEEKVVKYVP